MDNCESTMPGEGIPQTLYSLMRCLELRVRPHFRGTGLHWGLRRILQHLWVEDGRSQSELARAVRVSKASISNMLKHLVNGGWVERRPDPYDYRIARVFLTQRGIDLRSAVEAELSSIDQDLRATLPGKEYAELAGLLERILDRLTELP
ncbi:MarR family transcriptional regulator, partial [Candidatus Bipolaricaulota bacterium]|nr:MarR family transcriptional regulator [Candidatus Bipolaricaulota bacterium]